MARPAGFDSFEVDPVWGLASEDRAVIAQSLVTGKHRIDKSAPAAADLETAITDIDIQDTMQGSSTLTVTMYDENFAFTEAGFFDVNLDGKLDKIDLNYPPDSDLWWRLTQVGIAASGGGANLTLTFMERAAVQLMTLYGPVKGRRGKYTRAEFIQSLIRRANKKHGWGLKFHCRQLHTTGDPSSGKGRALWVGDSLTVGSMPYVKRKKKDITVDGKVGRTASQARDRLKQMLTSRYSTVIFDAGTNDDPDNPTAYRAILDDVMQAVGSFRSLVLLSLYAHGATMDKLYQAQKDFQAAHPAQVSIGLWHAWAMANPSHIVDGTHPDSTGYRNRGQLILACVGHGPKRPHAQKNKKPPDRKNKDKGLAGADITIAGAKADDTQLRQIARCMKTADELHPPERALQAMCCAGIGESSFRAVVNSIGYGGVFQGDVSHKYRYFDVDDTEEECRCFLQGGKGFQGGGAIHLAKTTGMDPGTIATTVEASGEAGSFYGKFLPEAKKIIAAWGGGGWDTGGGGGGSGGSGPSVYHFEVGGPNNPHEGYWGAMNRLAQEVRWAFFVDGQHVYYDPETSLIKQAPVVQLTRWDPSILDFSCTWDGRKIATECSLTLLCDPFEFRAGEVVYLWGGWGPMSSGSVVNLPGRWLISEVHRSRFSLSADLTLRQPIRPGPEPKGSSPTSDTKGGTGGGAGPRGSGDTASPFDGKAFAVTGAFGTQRPGHIHSGLDVGVPSGTKCTAPFDGTITYVAGSGFGVAGGMVHLRADHPVAGLDKGDKIGWGHCVNAKVHVGQKVAAGKVVAISNGSPAHVHFILIRKSGGKLGQGNGIDGNDDPSGFLKRVGGI
jgi:hypothetical protein